MSPGKAADLAAGVTRRWGRGTTPTPWEMVTAIEDDLDAEISRIVRRADPWGCPAAWAAIDRVGFASRPAAETANWRANYDAAEDATRAVLRGEGAI